MWGDRGHTLVHVCFSLADLAFASPVYRLQLEGQVEGKTLPRPPPPACTWEGACVLYPGCGFSVSLSLNCRSWYLAAHINYNVSPRRPVVLGSSFRRWSGGEKG